MNLRTCDGCHTPKNDPHYPADGTWWTFTRYLGKEPHATPGMALTGYYCSKCADAIYSEPGGFERAVAVSKVTKRLAPCPAKNQL